MSGSDHMAPPNGKSSTPQTPDQLEFARLTDQLVECIHCGLCLESCPTYVELNREEDSPRGRIYLMRAVAEGKNTVDPSVIHHLDVCLGCRACETACPSGVEYGSLLEHARTHIEEGGKRPVLRRLAKRVLLEVFTHSGIMAAAMWFATLPSRLLGRAPSAPSGIISKISGAHETSGDLHLQSFPPLRPRRLKAHYPAKGTAKMRVGMLEGCVMPVLFAEVNTATVRVLTKLGCEVVVPQSQGCCGALHVHNGFTTATRKMALRNIAAFEQAECDVIVVNSAGCGSTMKEYANLFEPGTPEHERASAFSARVKDVSEIVADLLPGAQMQPFNQVVTYHDACHLAHGQKIRQQPRDMLAAIPGITLAPLNESDHCCGSAGVYSFTQPEMAKTLQQRKVGNINATGAAIVATGNPGCQMWIRSGLKADGSPIQALHPIEIVDLALNGESDSSEA